MANVLDEGFDAALTGSAEDGIFGLPVTLDEARLVYIPVPWEATTSYGNGASQGPDAILRASPQLDLFIPGVADHFRRGFYLDEADTNIIALNATAKPLAEAVQDALESAGNLDNRPDLEAARAQVNAASLEVNRLVYERASALDAQGKMLAVIGGDHASPYGLIRFLSEKYQGHFGILHVDAHLDLRASYQGFQFSHASIMANVMALPQAPRALVQVGIRDFCKEEYDTAQGDERITVFYDEALKENLYQGETFAAMTANIVSALPEKVYISFDIDGLKPELCPHTGTPVAGGLEFEQARYLLKTLVQSGREIIGFDLCEVCPNPHNPADEWDGNVGARILFLLSTWMLESKKSGCP